MQVAQGTASWVVPVVVTLVAGIFGLAGVIVGQMINARREERRIALQNRDEDRKYWREVKLAACADLLQQLHDWTELFDDESGPVVTRDKISPTPAQMARMKEVSASINAPLARMYLVASRGLQEVCDDAVVAFRYAMRNLENQTVPIFPGFKEHDCDVPTDLYYEVVEKMRHELSLEALEDWKISSSRPSATTS